jgi:hypothetical protein
MRLGIQILSAALLAGAATAQTAPASQTVQQKPATSKVQNGTNAVKGPGKSPFAPKANPSHPTAAPASKSPVASKSQPPAATKKASVQTHPAATSKKASADARPPATKQAKATPKTAKTVPVKTAVKVPAPAPVVAAPTKPEQPVAQSAPAKLPSPGKRDPFLSPLSVAAARAPVASCSTGKHCLVVDQIALKGIVQTKEGNIAMVENGAKHSYYLHENDSLFDGSVEKISNDSVTFRQESSDILGRPVSKEVVKKVSAPAV